MKSSIRNVVLFFICSLQLIACGKGSEKVTHEDEHHEEGIVRLEETVQKSSGVETVLVKKANTYEALEVYGEIAQDTENTKHVSPDASGTVESLMVREGDVVEKDQDIARIKTDTDTKTLKATEHGVVMAIYAKVGERVDSLTPLATISDPDVMRASFDIYEKDLGTVSEGQEMIVKTSAYPEESFKGKVVFVSPRLDPETRTIKIRADIQNTEDHKLKFGMFLTAQLHKEGSEKAIIIPAKSIQSIEDKTVVFVKKDAETFERRSIVVGKEMGEDVIIISGLEDGETVAANGSFILKSMALKDEMGGHDD